ncbi:MAG TPA: hypothetical protein VNN09_13825, partial [Candidatus Competibacteraceae bacterium]|nr:hypothetical protein [Candidatus Competibacteraceae bacterium]
MDYQNPEIPPLARFALAMVLELPAAAVQSGARPPAPLERAAAGRLVTLIADDLRRLLPELTRFGLVLPGALYDLTELLRPGWPLLEALESVYRGTLRQGSFQPNLIALGSDSGHFSMPALNPLRRPGAGPLLLLPAVLVGPEDEMSAVAAVLENELLQRGAASAETRQSVQQGFGIEVLNLSYATLGDLCALTKVQLESQELTTLWVLLEQVLFRPGEALLVTLTEGNRFLHAGDGSFHTPFYTFDDWAGSGPGRDHDAARLAQGYGAWLLRQRQYLMALELHGCTVRQWLGHSWPEDGDAATVSAALDKGAAL